METLESITLKLPKEMKEGLEQEAQNRGLNLSELGRLKLDSSAVKTIEIAQKLAIKEKECEKLKVELEYFKGLEEKAVNILNKGLCLDISPEQKDMILKLFDSEEEIRDFFIECISNPLYSFYRCRVIDGIHFATPLDECRVITPDYDISENDYEKILNEFKKVFCVDDITASSIFHVNNMFKRIINKEVNQ